MNIHHTPVFVTASLNYDKRVCDDGNSITIGGFGVELGLLIKFISKPAVQDCHLVSVKMHRAGPN